MSNVARGTGAALANASMYIGQMIERNSRNVICNISQFYICR